VTIPATPPPITTIRCISLALLRRCTCPLQELQGGRCGVWIETLKVSIGRERAHRQDITVWRRDHADDALRSGPEHAGAEQRRSVRSSESRPLVEAMRPWLETQLGRISGPAASPTRSVTPSPSGRRSVISWMTAVSTSTTIPSNAAAARRTSIYGSRCPPISSHG